MALIRARYRRYPGLVRAIQTRAVRYNQTLEWMAQKEREGSLLILAPDQPLALGRVEKNKHKLLEGYRAGVSVAARERNRLKEFVGFNKLP